MVLAGAGEQAADALIAGIIMFGQTPPGHALIVRFAAFVVVFAIMAGWEIVSPRRTRELSRGRRWPSNLLIALLNGVCLGFLPATAISVALLTARNGWGLLNYLHLPATIAFICGVIALDLVIYLQHLVFHAVPLLWRIHRMHHADLELDVTTGVRFHPFEIFLSMLIKLVAVVALGPSALAVLVFEIVLNGTSMFNHGNVRIPAGFERIMRWLVVTPEMHRVHHSTLVADTNSNFGFNLSCWDRLFGTYRASPAAGEAMNIGIEQFREARELRLDRMLLQPFRGSAGAYPMHWRAA